MRDSISVLITADEDDSAVAYSLVDCVDVIEVWRQNVPEPARLDWMSFHYTCLRDPPKPLHTRLPVLKLSISPLNSIEWRISSPIFLENIFFDRPEMYRSWWGQLPPACLPWRHGTPVSSRVRFSLRCSGSLVKVVSSKWMFRVHNVSQWPNLRHLGESLGGVEGLLEAVSFKKATKWTGRGRVENSRRDSSYVQPCSYTAVMGDGYLKSSLTTVVNY